MTIRLLGTPLVTVDGAPVAGLVNSKALALLSWLVLEGDRPHLREGLAAKFWRDQPEHLANQNLRQLLTRLRRAIRDSEASPPHILVTAHQVQFDRTSDYWLDVEAFEGLLDQAARHPHRRLEACPSCLKRLGAAIAIYRGALLDGFGLSGGDPSFDEWLAIERERLQMRACAAMHAVANRHLACGRPESAFLVALRLLQQDPWNESAERIVMHALALSDGRNEALAHYRAFRASLLRDLGVEPEDATRRLEAQIRSGRLPVSGLRGSAGTTPLPGTRLVGRQTEIATIRNHLASRDRRLVTIHGPGGSGKTRLALEVAQREAPLWQDGVWFVPLSEVASVEGLTCALASSLDIPSSGREFALGDIIAACGDKEALLVLDSFDQLVSEAEVVSEVLGSAPRLKVVVTSDPFGPARGVGGRGGRLVGPRGGHLDPPGGRVIRLGEAVRPRCSADRSGLRSHAWQRRRRGADMPSSVGPAAGYRARCGVGAGVVMPRNGRTDSAEPGVSSRARRYGWAEPHSA